MTLLWIDQNSDEVFPAAIKMGTIILPNLSEVGLELVGKGDGIYEIGNDFSPTATNTGTATGTAT